MAVCQRCKVELVEIAALPITQIDGSVESVVMEMKRRCGFKHDSQLAAFMGRRQTLVPKWRARGNIPISALLRFEKLLSEAHC